MITVKQKIEEACAAINKKWQAFDADFEQKPEVIITVGSGLGSLVELLIPNFFEMSYNDIPHLSPSGAEGHRGRIAIGLHRSNKKKIIVLDGRIHGYEGHNSLTQALPLLIAHQLCSKSESPLVILTNAAGAINECFKPGQIMLINDHINFMGKPVLELSEEWDFGGDNLDMTYTYTPALRDEIREIARQNNIDLAEGVYIGTTGAMFETPAEIRAFRMWGADAVGMSTIHEATAASRLGLPVIGLSVLSNMAAGIEAKSLTLEEVLDGSKEAAQEVFTLLDALLYKKS